MDYERGALGPLAQPSLYVASSRVAKCPNLPDVLGPGHVEGGEGSPPIISCEPQGKAKPNPFLQPLPFPSFRVDSLWDETALKLRSGISGPTLHIEVEGQRGCT